MLPCPSGAVAAARSVAENTVPALARRRVASFDQPRERLLGDACRSRGCASVAWQLCGDARIVVGVLAMTAAPSPTW